MRKRTNIKMGIPTETAESSQWVFTYPEQLGNLHKTEVGPLNMGDICVAWGNCGATGRGTRIYPYCMNWSTEAHSLQTNIFLSLDTGGSHQVLVLVM